MNLRLAAPAARAGLILLAFAGGGSLAQAPPVPPPAPAQAKAPADLKRLEELVRAAEKAQAEGRREAAAERVEEAGLLVAGWSADAGRLPETQALLERLRILETAPQGQGTPGLKVEEEVLTLSGDELRAELEHVRAAEGSASFDFPIDLNDKVLTWVREFSTTRRAFIERSLSRAARYLPMVRQVFAEEGVPQDLAYLAVIESGYQNHARSYAAAVGMWQFIRSTGRIYGLKGNAWVEERRDPMKSTRAAARYLRRLYETSGDWYLALVGYNAGPLTTERAIANVGSRNFWDLARSRWLRNQTKNYVPEVCAAALVGRFPERYGLKIEQGPPFVFETVQVDRMTSLAVLARMAGVGVEDLKDLNPELLRGSTPPNPYPLRVPPGFGPPTARALARLTPAQRLDFQTHVLRKGETLAKVAARFKVSPEDLLAANDLSPAQFKSGRKIKVPPRSAMPLDSKDLRARSAPTSMADQPLEALPGFPRVPEPAPSQEPARPAAEPRPEVRPALPAPAPARPSGKPGRFVIAGEGDTLAVIARIHGVSLPALLQLNPDHSIRLHAGDRVRLPDEEAPLPVPAAKFHLVQRGETLYAVARRYGLDPAELKSWNRLPDSKVKAGQRLRLSPP